jgi:hypothetical protein
VSAAPLLLDALAGLARVFAAAGVRWYVFGAQAVVLYGQPRLTADLDVTVEGTPESVLALLPGLLEHGFEPRLADPEELLRRARILPLVHSASGLPVDLVVAGPGLEDEFLAHRRHVELGGVAVPVISPEDLIVTKLLAGRPKDLDDARGVLRDQGGGLDLERSRRFLRLLEQALDRSDLVSTLDRLLDG